ncbi:MAG: glycosyltransferase [Gemmatimonadetes bacterium]|nr:glycosyltransferase [Gemmatimonadota bacterium]
MIRPQQATALASVLGRPELATSRRPVVRVSVVGTVVGGGNDGFVAQCIDSLQHTTRDAPLTLAITAIDNSPGYGLSRLLRDRFAHIDIIENETHRGFAANHNMALADPTADYFLVANDDVIFLPGALGRAVAFLEDPANARVGVVGFQLRNPDDTVQPSTYSFPTLTRALLELSGLRRWIPFAAWTNSLAKLLGRGDGRSRFWAHDRTLPVDTFRGAVMLVRGEAAREVGPMDEVSLIGGEETEWHQRFWGLGWSVVFLHEAEVIHFGSQTLEVAPRLRAEMLKGLLNYFRKHRPGYQYWSLRFLAIPALAVRVVAQWLTGDRALLAVTRDQLRILVRWRPVAPSGPRATDR